MFYDFVLTQGDDRGSIMPVRKYKSPTLSSDVVASVNGIIRNAIKESGVFANQTEEVEIEFGKSWVEEKKQYDDSFEELLDDAEWFDSSTGELKSKGPRIIAKQILTDLAATHAWELRYNGAADAFDNLDFSKFSFYSLDTTINNDNLKIPIGEKVYIYRDKDKYLDTKIYTYQGRPANYEIAAGNRCRSTGSDVYSVENHVVKVSDVDMKTLFSRIETFPLPSNVEIWRGINVLGENRYFSREKTDNKPVKKADRKPIRETMGKTQKESKTRLALLIAFEEKVAENNQV